MTLGDKCKKSYMELILKWGSVKMQVYGKKRFSDTHVFERLIFSSQGKAVVKLSKLSLP